LPWFESKEFLHEFKDLDLPNEVWIVAPFVLLQGRTDNQSLACPEQVKGGAKVTGRGLSSRANARDLRKTFPGVYPELGSK